MENEKTENTKKVMTQADQVIRVNKDLVCKRMKLLRSERGISQKFLAQKVGITNIYYCKIEKGAKPLTSFLALKLANYFGVSPLFLMGISNSQTISNDQGEESLELTTKAYSIYQKIKLFPEEKIDEVEKIIDSLLSLVKDESNNTESNN